MAYIRYLLAMEQTEQQIYINIKIGGLGRLGRICIAPNTPI